VKVTTLIADDEPFARAGLRAMLTAIDWIQVVGEAANGPAAIDAIDALRPDLVLLDIRMPGLLGTDVPQRTTHQPLVIFTTAFAQHAVTAFELGALDYLLKPFGPERLERALDRVRTAVGEPNGSQPVDRLRELLSAAPMSRLFVRLGPTIVPVAVAAISYFEADGDYVAAYANGARHLVHVSLNRIESRLDPARFTRIHRQHIVNLDHVVAFRRHGKGRMLAELRDGTRLEVSRARAHEVRERSS
jgi:two-component system LytT family response regulator